MSNRGVQEFYYTRNLPTRAVAIAHVHTDPSTPSQLTDINNIILNPGVLGVWKSTTLDSSPADFTAPDINIDMSISGDTNYRIDNQFFKLTNQSLNGVPLYYIHQLDTDQVDQVTIVDLDGNPVDDVAFTISGNKLYHSIEGTYRVRYIASDGFLKTYILHHDPVLSQAVYSPSSTTFVLVGRSLQVSTTGAMYIKFTARNGFQAVAPYTTPPNTPWYARIRFNLRPIASEWARQVFLPNRPYVLAVWVPGRVLEKNIVEFERKRALYDRNKLPDILVFDKNYVFKYALEGTLPGTPKRRGSLYNWKRGLIAPEGFDWNAATVELGVDLAPDDIVFGFYSYIEQDVIYQGIDCNPFTNPDVKNKIVEFYYKVDGSQPFNTIFHRVKDPTTGSYIAGLTNDTNPGSMGTLFSTLIVGASVGTKQFDVADARQRGGGLSVEWQNIPEAVNFWDLGYWDGKPYPVGGAVMVYLPNSLKDRMDEDDIEGRVVKALPMGVAPVIVYYDTPSVASRAARIITLAEANVTDVSTGTGFGTSFGTSF